MYLIDHVAELRSVNRFIYAIKRIYTHHAQAGSWDSCKSDEFFVGSTLCSSTRILHLKILFPLLKLAFISKVSLRNRFYFTSRVARCPVLDRTVRYFGSF